jgi:hypothetical protein
MNERIRELRCKAQELAAEAFPGNVPFDPNPNPILWDRIHISYEKFAELIVRECIDQLYKDEIISVGAQVVLTENIKQHFGVE